MIVVINLHRQQPREAVNVGRPSPLGNPFSHLEGTRAAYRVASRKEAVDRYRDWLRQAWLRGDRAVVTALADLAAHYRREGRLVLGCWCAPQPCHAHHLARVIPQVAEWLDRGRPAGWVWPEDAPAARPAPRQEALF